MDDISSTAAAFTVGGACRYSGLSRTYLYQNRDRLDWRKAGRRSLITRRSLDDLIAALPKVSLLADTAHPAAKERLTYRKVVPRHGCERPAR